MSGRTCTHKYSKRPSRAWPVNGQYAFRTQRKPPGETFRMQCCRWADLVKFCQAHSSFLRRRITEPGVPNGSPDESEHAECIEGCTPPVADLNRHNQQGRDSTADLTCHQQDSGHARALCGREPTRDNDRRVGKCPCFSATEAKSRYQQKIVVPHH